MARIRGGVHQVSNADLTVMIQRERGVRILKFIVNKFLKMLIALAPNKQWY
jgi:hypothetical protein